MNNTSNFTFKPNLLFCIIMDILGMVTFTIPGIGEFGDVVWAPLSAFIFYKTFGGTKGLIGGILNGLEEILPFTDIIPSFTIMYFLQNAKSAG